MITDAYRKEIVHIGDESLHLYNCAHVFASYDTNSRTSEEFKIHWLNGKVSTKGKVLYRSVGCLRSSMRPYDPVEENRHLIFLLYFFNLMLCHPRIKSSCMPVHFFLKR